MDSIIKQYDYVQDGDLIYCENQGVAYQEDMSKSVLYDREYFEKYKLYEITNMGEKLNRARVEIVKNACRNMKIIDIGVGCGTFIKHALASDLDIRGYDINPCAVHWLVKSCLYEDVYKTEESFRCFTFWDSLEHIPDPQKIFEKISIGSYVFVSIPIFEDLKDIKQSKHYRPNEHYYYFTNNGILRWFKNHNMRLMGIYDFEEKLGRENIKTFMFEKTIFTPRDKMKHMMSDYLREGSENGEQFREMRKE